MHLLVFQSLWWWSLDSELSVQLVSDVRFLTMSQRRSNLA